MIAISLALGGIALSGILYAAEDSTSQFGLTPFYIALGTGLTTVAISGIYLIVRSRSTHNAIRDLPPRTLVRIDPGLRVRWGIPAPRTSPTAVELPILDWRFE